MPAITQNEALRRFRAAYGDKYDYSKVVYVNNYTPVTVICPEHGEFTPRPYNHWSGAHKCVGCDGAARRAKNGETIVEKFVTVHGTRFDYSRVEYVSALGSKVEILCSKHGSFWMTPRNHLAGRACPSCFNGATSKQETEWLDALDTALGDVSDRQHRVKNCRKPADAVYGNVIVEFDGSFWHSRSGDLARDIKKTATLVESGYVVVRLRSGTPQWPLLTDVPGAYNVHVGLHPTSSVLSEIADLVGSLRTKG